MAYQRDRIVGVFAGFRTKVIFMKKMFLLFLIIAILFTPYFAFSLEDLKIESIEDCKNNANFMGVIKIEKISCDNIFDKYKIFPLNEDLNCNIIFSNNAERKVLLKYNVGIFLEWWFKPENNKDDDYIRDSESIRIPLHVKDGYFVIEKDDKWNQTFRFMNFKNSGGWRYSIFTTCGKDGESLYYKNDNIQIVSKDIFGDFKRQEESLISEKQDSENSFFIAKLSLIVAIVAILASTILAPLISNRFFKNKINKVEITNLKNLNKVLKTNNTKNKLKRK